MGRPEIPMPDKPCEQCGTPMSRRRFNGRLEDRGVFRRRRFCNLRCSGDSMVTDAPTLGTLRSRSRRVPLARSCDHCGDSRLLNRHHRNGDKADNSPSNVQTLCASCHTRLHWATGKRKPSKRSDDATIAKLSKRTETASYPTAPRRS